MRNRKRWTALIYLAAFNTLREELIYDLKEMKRVGETDDLHLVAQLDLDGPRDRPFVITMELRDGLLKNDIDRQREIRINGGPISHRPASSIAERTGPALDYRSMLRDFIIWGITEFPADHYLLVLSGHGSGTLGDFLRRNQQPGEPGPDSIGIPDLSGIFEEAWAHPAMAGFAGKGRKIDILGMDSCLMSSAEVCYQLRDYAEFFVGAEGFEPLAGWPYAGILEDFSKSGPRRETRKALARRAGRIVKNYINYYSDYTIGGVSVDYSASDLSRSRDLTDAVKALGKALTRGLRRSGTKRAILLSHWAAQSYKFDQFTDLYDFCDLLIKDRKCDLIPDDGKRDVEIRKACHWVKQVIRDGDTPMVIKSCYCGPAVQYSYGVSIYFPWNRTMLSPEYNNLDFAERTQWYSFLEKYVDATCRAARNDTGLPVEEFIDSSPIFSAPQNPGLPGGRFTSPNRFYPSIQNGVGQIGTARNWPQSFFACSCDDADR